MQDDKKNFKYYKALSIAFSLTTSIIAGVVIGYYIDKKAKTAPLFILLFLFSGIFFGFFNLFKIVSKKWFTTKKKQ